jgi:hypothetical protein
VGLQAHRPDLHRVGGKYPDAWHYLHMYDPVIHVAGLDHAPDRLPAATGHRHPAGPFRGSGVMLRNLFAEMGGIGIYGLVSMLLFFLTFGIALLVTLRMGRAHARKMGRLPLETDDPTKGAPRDDH